MAQTNDLITWLEAAASYPSDEAREARAQILAATGPKIYGICHGIFDDPAYATACFKAIYAMIFAEAAELAQASSPVMGMFSIVCDHTATHARGIQEAPLFAHSWDMIADDPHAVSYYLFETAYLFGHTYEDIAQRLDLPAEDLAKAMHDALFVTQEEQGLPINASSIRAAEFVSGLMNEGDVDAFIDEMAASEELQTYMREWSTDLLVILEQFPSEPVPELVLASVLEGARAPEGPHEPVGPVLARSGDEESLKDEEEMPDEAWEGAPAAADPPRYWDEENDLKPKRIRSKLATFMFVGLSLVLVAIILVLAGPYLQRVLAPWLTRSSEEVAAPAARFFYFAPKGGEISWQGALSADGLQLELSPKAGGAAQPLSLWLAVGGQAPIELAQNITGGGAVTLTEQIAAVLPRSLLLLAPRTPVGEPLMAQALFAALYDEALYAWE